MKRSKSNPLELGLALALLGLLVLIISLLPLNDLRGRPSLEEMNRRIETLSKWPKAEGQMDELSIEDAGGTIQHYVGRVKYHYFIGDKLYRGDCFGMTSCSTAAETFPYLSDDFEPFFLPSDKGKSDKGKLEKDLTFTVDEANHRVAILPTDNHVRVFYDPADPGRSVLSARDIDGHVYLANPDLKPLTWQEYTLAPFVATYLLMLVGLALLVFGLSTLPWSRHTRAARKRRKAGDASLELEQFRAYHPRTNTYVYKPCPFLVALFLHAFALFWFAFALYAFQMYWPQGATTTAVVSALFFGFFGVVCMLPAGSKTVIDAANGVVKQDLTLGWLSFIRWRRSRPFSDYSHVELSGSHTGNRASGYAFYACYIVLIAKNQSRSLALYSGTVAIERIFSKDEAQIPEEVRDCAEEVGKILQISCKIVSDSN